MTFYGLKKGLDLENRAAHPYQEFQGVPFPPPPPPPRLGHPPLLKFTFINKVRRSGEGVERLYTLLLHLKKRVLLKQESSQRPPQEVT